MIRYYELEDNNLHYITTYQSPSPLLGACCMPKRCLDHLRCEVMRFYELKLRDNMVEPITFVVPRKVCPSHMPTNESYFDEIFSLTHFKMISSPLVLLESQH